MSFSVYFITFPFKIALQVEKVESFFWTFLIPYYHFVFTLVIFPSKMHYKCILFYLIYFSSECCKYCHFVYKLVIFQLNVLILYWYYCTPRFAANALHTVLPTSVAEQEPVWRSGSGSNMDETEKILNAILFVCSNID